MYECVVYTYTLCGAKQIHIFLQHNHKDNVCNGRLHKLCGYTDLRYANLIIYI